MKPMTYSGYAARIEYSDEDECLIGHIAGIRDIVGFHGDSVAELRAAFRAAVDNYLAASERLGRDPQKPYSGTLTVRVASELHASVAMQAQASGKSINQWAAEALERAVQTG
jgi:predicted HicB family RNase H-like nuclease